MGVCLLEVPTVHDDGVANVFWAQRYLNLSLVLEILEKGSSEIGRTWNILDWKEDILIWIISGNSTWDTGATRGHYTSKTSKSTVSKACKGPGRTLHRHCHCWPLSIFHPRSLKDNFPWSVSSWTQPEPVTAKHDQLCTGNTAFGLMLQELPWGRQYRSRAVCQGHSHLHLWRGEWSWHYARGWETMLYWHLDSRYVSMVPRKSLMQF